MRQLRRWKRLWRRSLTRSRKRTSMGPSRNGWNDTSALQPEKITSKGVEFNVCSINKMSIRKKSGNLYKDPCICTLWYEYPLLLWPPKSTYRCIKIRYAYAHTCLYRRQSWCYSYSRMQCSRWPGFKSWIRLFLFLIALTHNGNVWIQSISLQIWINWTANRDP